MNGLHATRSVEGREPRFGTAGMWTKIAVAVLTAVLLGGGAMLLRHETALAVNAVTVANIESKLTEVKADTADTKKTLDKINDKLGEIGRSVRRD